MKTGLGVAVGRLAFAGSIALVGTATSMIAVTWMTQDPRVAEERRPPTPTFELVAPPPELAPPPDQPAIEQPAAVPAQAQSAAPPPVGRTPSASAPPGLPELASLPAGLPALGSGLPLGIGLGAPSSAMPALDESTPDTPARPVTRPAPRYPRTAQLSGIEGVVVVRLRVDERGRVTDVVVVDASPDGVFDDVAVAAAKGYRFAPARKGGKAVATTVEQRIVFRLGR